MMQYIQRCGERVAWSTRLVAHNVCPSCTARVPFLEETSRYAAASSDHVSLKVPEYDINLWHNFGCFGGCVASYIY